MVGVAQSGQHDPVLAAAIDRGLHRLAGAGCLEDPRAVLDKVEAGLTSDLLEQLPLIGDIADFGGTFIGDLNFMIIACDGIWDCLTS